MMTCCPDCNGVGRKKIAFFRTKICPTCNGKKYVRAAQAPEYSRSSLDAVPFADDVITRADLASIANHHSQPEFSGQGGGFGGAGANAHWDTPHSDSKCDNQISTTSDNSVSDGCSGDSGGGGD